MIYNELNDDQIAKKAIKETLHEGMHLVSCKSCGETWFVPGNLKDIKYPIPLEMTQELADEIEQTIITWAKQNPEPVYPTFREWLISIGVIDQMSTHSVIADALTMTHIPAGIAQKLGIRPKEEP